MDETKKLINVMFSSEYRTYMPGAQRVLREQQQESNVDDSGMGAQRNDILQTLLQWVKDNPVKTVIIGAGMATVSYFLLDFYSDDTGNSSEFGDNGVEIPDDYRKQVLSYINGIAEKIVPGGIDYLQELEKTYNQQGIDQALFNGQIYPGNSARHFLTPQSQREIAVDRDILDTDRRTRVVDTSKFKE